MAAERVSRPNKHISEVVTALILFTRFIIKSYYDRELLFMQDEWLSSSGGVRRATGFLCVAVCCALWGAVLGGMVSRADEKRRTGAALFAAFTLACPAAFPFLQTGRIESAADVLPEILFALSLLCSRVKTARLFNVLSVAVFSFSFYLPALSAFSRSTALYLPALLLVMSLYAFNPLRQTAPKKKRGTKNNDAQKKLVFCVCAAIAIAGAAARRASGAASGTDGYALQSGRAASLAGGIAMLLPVVFFIVHFLICTFGHKGRDRLLLHLSLAELAVLAVCVFNYGSFSRTGLTLLVAANLIIIGYVLAYGGDDCDASIEAWVRLYSRRPAVTVCLIAWMALFTAASAFTLPGWLAAAEVY